MHMNRFELPNDLLELTKFPNWVCYSKFPDKKNPDGTQHYGKRPLDPKKTTARKPAYARANDPQTWGTYLQAYEAWTKYPNIIDGIGFQFGNSPYCGIDLDHVVDPSGEVSQEAKDIIQMLDSYSEWSPSWSGFHILMKGKLPDGGRNRKGNIEMYETGRFFTVTGNQYGTSPIREQEANERIKAVSDKYVGQAKQDLMDWADYTAPTKEKSRSRFFDDRQRLEEIENSKIGSKFKRLWAGDDSDFNGDHSRADQALANYLVWFCWHDLAQADRLFRKSGLMRDKWDAVHDPANNRTYGQMTLYGAATGSNKRQETQAEYAPSVDYQRPLVKDEMPTEEQEKSRLKKLIEDAQTSRRIQDFIDHIQESAYRPEMATGFKKLDEILDGGLHPGLYTIGAISSLGKTTFALQIADYIAMNGSPVIIISMEMGRDELISKSISRLSYLKAYEAGNLTLAKSARAITNGKQWGTTDTESKWKPFSKAEIELLVSCINEYETGTAKNIYIFEGSGAMTHEQIRSIVQTFTEVHSKPPLVLVDYVQILRPADPKLSDKQAVDQSVLALKNISRDFKCPVIAISSLNRANYKAKVDFEAFKESGALEYGSDVVIGLQLRGAGEGKDFDTLAAKAKETRDIELRLLKNRSGQIPPEPFQFTFKPKFNYFEEQ